MKTFFSLFSFAAISSPSMAFGVVSRGLARPTFVQVLGAASARPAFNTARMMSSSPLPSTSSELDFAQAEIDSNKVVVFSKSYCPFCSATKSLLTDMNVEYTLHELDQMDNGSSLQAALLDMSGQRTVPNVFINGEHVGGNDKLQAAARSGALQEMLEK